MRYNRNKTQGTVKQLNPVHQAVIVSSIDDESTMIEWERQMREKWGFDDEFIASFKEVRSQEAYRRYCEQLNALPPPITKAEIEEGPDVR